ncbi:MAG: protein CapI [Candidatus Marinimicrobia bacterium]|nr:protein CapI [Candidatus Neomarinimicrobiota bacterium]|tara:strand:- start:3490 stop:4452 length:963 start_codon:yes stop_codon:yes gene_type:complete
MVRQKILVTGSAGFIGFHLCKSLLNDNQFEVLGVDIINDYYDTKLKNSRLNQLLSYDNFKFDKVDIADKKAISNSFQLFKPNKVINLAAQAGVRYSIDNPYAYLESNLSGFVNIIELCRNSNVEGLIYASSSSVYGGNDKIPFNIIDRVDNPISLYAATKRSNELIANSYSHLYNLHTTGLRFFTVYGPWGRPDMAMYIFTKNIIEGKPIPVFNNGNMKRDFTYIDDIIFGIRSAMDKNFKCEIFNLGNNRSEELMFMIELLENSIGKKAKIKFKSMQLGDVQESYADIQYSIDRLNYNPKTIISKGIPKFVKWYMDFYK